MINSKILSIVVLLLFGIVSVKSTDLSECFDSRSTWYEAVEHGNCGYGPLMGPTGPGHRFIAAAATSLYNGSASCGECFEIYGPSGTQQVVVVDQCPDPGWCDTDFPHLDLSPQAFEVVIGNSLGVAMTTVKKVACDYVQGNIKLLMKDADTTPSWFEFMVYNHRIGIDHIDIETVDGKVYPLLRRLYNYWTFNQGVATFPIVARVYSIYGERVDIYIQSPDGNKQYEGEGQFTDANAKIFEDTCSAPLSVDKEGWIYNNGLVKPGNHPNPNLGWTDWSNGITVNWNDSSTAGVDADSKSVASATLGHNTGIQIGTDLPLNWSGIFTALEFYVKSDSTFNDLIVEFGSKSKTTPVTSSWTHYSYSLDTDLGAPESLGKPAVLKFRNAGSSSPKIYLDKIRLTPVASSASA
ncbi:expansin-like protein [Tieghemostelium lacteum]|uniref:Expansin-like protein n=1 Tax=Tieghemostelium lacteum TaxID=361077 RepID=A0A151ZJK1_TIELA|nr:expansin-like protein [Tieghemostelium lacteum]|eukprot:KYQ94172.1 expansin-like protein [Tieghemostelium lacteum]